MVSVERRVPLWAVLVIAAVAQFMVILDTTIVNVALPGMERDLGLSVVGQQWVVNAYVLAFGGFLLLGGRLADLFGRRRVFATGLVVFTLASLLGGLAQSGGMLIGARVAQGLGAAVLAPATLSLLTTTYTEAKARTTALTVWAITASSGGVAGVVLGGVLTSALDWRWVLFVNVPIGLGLLLAAFAYLTESPGSARGWRTLDLPGAVTVTAGLALLTYAIVATDTHAWSSVHTVGLLTLGVLLIVVFLLIEARHPRPLVPLRIFAGRTLNAANLIAVVIGVTATSYLFFVSLYLQEVNGYSAVRGGLAMAPAAAATAVASLLGGRLVARIGARALLVVGPVLAAGGMFWMARLSAGDGYAGHILAPTMLTMFGMGLCFVPMTTLATTGVARADAGLASGLLNAARQVGGAVGLAALVTAATARTAGFRADHPGGPAADALAAGYDLGFLVAGVLFLLVVVVAVTVLPAQKPVIASAVRGSNSGAR
ncbi:MFS transporter [Asanoa siamensis]|uniref:MFS transporter n=1 Tax=Asanoa siamensis TaxID=926357 RepID=A0ABQ4D0S0_9ACTN|nr:MFS transporter [Asanoa siamensis]